MTSHTFVGCHDTQHNDIQHNDIQHNGIEHIDTQHNSIQHNDIQHNEIQNNDIQHSDFQHNGIQHNDKQPNDNQPNINLNGTLSIIAFHNAVVVILSDANNASMLSVANKPFMLIAIMINAVILTVVAPSVF